MRLCKCSKTWRGNAIMATEMERLATQVVEACKNYVKRAVAQIGENVAGLVQRADKHGQQLESLERRASRQGDHLQRLEDRVRKLEGK